MSRPCSSALRRLAGIRPAGRKIIISRISGADPHLAVLGRHLVLEELRQPGQHGGTGHRAGQRAHAAEDDVGDDEDRVVQHEVLGVERPDLAGEEDTGDAGGRGADREGQQLDPGGVDAGRLRGDLVLADRGPGAAEPGVLQPVEQQITMIAISTSSRYQYGEGAVAPGEVERTEVDRRGRDVERAARAVGEAVGVVGDDPDDLTEAERDDREVVAAQPQRRGAERDAGDQAGRDGERDGAPAG